MGTQTDNAKIEDFTDSLKVGLLDNDLDLSKDKKQEFEGGVTVDLNSMETLPSGDKALPEGDTHEASLDSGESRHNQARFKRGSRRSHVNDQYLQELLQVNQNLNSHLEYNHQFYQNELARLSKERDEEALRVKALEEHNLKLSQDYLVKGLLEAKELGDYDSEAKIQAALSQVSTDLSLADIKYAQRPPLTINSLAQRYDPPKPQQVETPVQYREEYLDWVDRNPWFLPDSEEYSSALAQKVMTYANELNEHLIIRNQGNQIDSQEYYNTLDAIIRSQYGIDSKGSDQPQDFAPTQQYNTPQPQTQNTSRSYPNPVAPVQRTPALAPNQVQVNRGHIYLTPEEKEIALSRIKNHSDGRPFSHNELLQHHAQLMAKLQEHDQAYGITAAPHKTTLII